MYNERVKRKGNEKGEADPEGFSHRNRRRRRWRGGG